VRVQIAGRNAQGDTVGKVVQCPGWMTVHPLVFEGQTDADAFRHRRQSGRVRRSGRAVRVEMGDDTIDIPVSITRRLPATFIQVSAWYVPLFAATLLPVAAVLYAKRRRPRGSECPGGLCAGGAAQAACSP